MDLLTVGETAAVLRVSPETIRRWLRKGELTGADTPAGWRIAKTDIEAWLAKYRRTPVAETESRSWATDLKPWAPNGR